MRPTDAGESRPIHPTKLHGVKYSVSDDRYYSLITARWSTVIFAMAALYFGTALIFALLVYADMPGGISALGDADAQGYFGDAWFFSIQALSTIGYGSLSPNSDATNTTTNFEAAVGVFLIALINGVVWGKFFTIGQANAIFSRHAVMELHERADGGGDGSGNGDGGGGGGGDRGV